MDNSSKFSERLSDLMFDAGLTTDQLGTKIGVDGSAIRLWKEKKNFISLSNAVLIANYFNCTLDYLFGFSDDFVNFTPHLAPSFYERLREIMKSKGKSRYRVCIDLKKSHGHFDKWKKGVDPFMYTIIELAVYFDVSLDYLVGREN